jgi:hypothetical protein
VKQQDNYNTSLTSCEVIGIGADSVSDIKESIMSRLPFGLANLLDRIIVTTHNKK